MENLDNLVIRSILSCLSLQDVISWSTCSKKIREKVVFLNPIFTLFGKTKIYHVNLRGKLEGLYIDYYFNNNPHYFQWYKDGKRHGQYIHFRIDGSIRLWSNYKMDQLDGNYREYNINNKLVLFRQYKEGWKDGLSIRHCNEMCSKFYLKGHRINV